jgi:hypothetical protein
MQTAGRQGSTMSKYTLIHLSLSQDIVDGIDTLLWLRVTAAARDVEAIRRGKHRIYDEAVEFFLSKYERRSCEALKDVGSHGWRTVRVQSTLADRCKQVATRSGVAVGSVVSCALMLFVEHHVQPAWRDFRSSVRAQARSVLNSKSR